MKHALKLNLILILCFVSRDSLASPVYRGGSDVFKSAWQTSTYGDRDARNAIDGDVMVTSHTLCDGYQQLILYLHQDYNVRVRSIKFINGKTNWFLRRLNGVEIYVEDVKGYRQSCGTVSTRLDETIEGQTYYHDCKYGYGNKILFYQPRSECLELAEVYVDIDTSLHPTIRDVSLSSVYYGGPGWLALDRSVTTAAHTGCSGRQWIQATFKEIRKLNSATIINGKLNSYYYRLNGTKVFALNGELRTLCGVITVTGDLSQEGQTYNIACGDGIPSTALLIELDNNDCLCVAELDVQTSDLNDFNYELHSFLFGKASTKTILKGTDAEHAIDGNIETEVLTRCNGHQWIKAQFGYSYLDIYKITVVVGLHPNASPGTTAQIQVTDDNGKDTVCGNLQLGDPGQYDFNCRVDFAKSVTIKTNYKGLCIAVAEIIPWGKLYDAGSTEEEVIPTTVYVEQMVNEQTGVEYDADFNQLHDKSFRTGFALTNKENSPSEHKVYLGFGGDATVSRFVLYIEDIGFFGGDFANFKIDAYMETYGEVEYAYNSANDFDFNYATEQTSSTTISSTKKNCEALTIHVLNTHTRVVEIAMDCHNNTGYSLVILAGFDRPYELDILETRIYGKVAEINEVEDMGFDGDDLATDYSHFPLFSSTVPTESPYEISEEMTDVLLKSEPSVFEETKNDGAIWEPTLKSEVPLTQIKKSKSEVMSYLLDSGYLNFVLENEAAITRETNKSERQQLKKEGSKKTRRSTTSKKPQRKVVKNSNIVDSIVMLQKFNGFPETGQVSRDVIEFMSKPRCGNNDLEYSPELKKEEDGLCFSIIQSRKVDWNAVESVSCGSLSVNGKARSLCVSIPSKGVETFVKPAKYYINIDLFYRGTSTESWKKLTDIFAIYYNFDSTIGKSGYGDKVQLFADEENFGFQYQEITEGAPKTVQLKHKLTKTQLTRREFKIRVDVEEGGKAYLLVDNKDVGIMPYSYPMRSQAMIRWALQAPDIITARLCRHPDKKALGRKRRYAVSLHSWGSNEITFNFQNYSTSLGEEKTRRGILEALKVITDKVKIKFVEKNKHELVMLSYMFIKGKHADGMSFDGAGREKAHAFSPAHSEVHFNDWEKFTLEREDKATSLFFVTLHETGHALGLKHSEYRQAVMNAGYNEDLAFSFKDFHRDDVNAIKFQYPDSATGSGEVKPLVERKTYSWYKYRPRMPFPVECFNRVDAAVSVDESLYIISNVFLWQYKAADLTPVGEVTAISKRFPSWNYHVKAAFGVKDRVFLVSDEFVARYRHVKTATGSSFMLEAVGRIDSMLLPKGSKEQIPVVSSAFSMDEGGRVKTVLIINNKLWYEVVWKNYKKVLSATKVEDPTGTKLTGKSFNIKEFNAALLYTRTIGKTKTKSTEVLKFDLKFGSSIIPFPKEPRSKNPYFNVPDTLKIKGWCK